MEHTSARLRKTFHYPVDGDGDDDLPEALDEEEQETLIHNLRQQNELRNAQYRLFLSLLPPLSVIPYLTTLLTPHLRLLSILSITSLYSTAYLLYVLPAGRTGLSFLDAHTSQPKPRSQRIQDPDDGPVLTYLPYLNIALCVMLVLLSWVAEWKLGDEAGLWRGFGWLPAGVYAVVLTAKWIMGSVDPESELGGLRYGFKGA